MWYLRKSSDGGVSWRTINLFQYASGASAFANSITSDANGNLFASGSAPDSSGLGHWLVRKSSDAGETWASSDDFTAGLAQRVDFLPDAGLFAAGTIRITSGKGGKSTPSNCWLVRRSVDNGITWSSVDRSDPPAGYSDYPFAGAAADAQGNVYVAGRTTIVVTNGRTTTPINQWLVRKSTSAGAPNTWTSLDVYSYAPGKPTAASGIGRDAHGNIVVAGTATDSAGSNHWIVRRLNPTGTWQTIDDFQLVSGRHADADKIKTDAAGNLLITGTADDINGSAHWIVRRLPLSAL